MRLIADENVHGKVVKALRAKGYAPEWVRDMARGADDADLLARPDMAGAIFITNDRDFGDLIFHRGLPPPLAILYTRLEHRDWQMTTDRLVAELEAGIAQGQITTITKDRVRRRPFPSGVDNG